MIDPLVALAFAIQHNKGIYALLLGSGLSRSAGIPTGWEVVLDLARRLAKTGGDDPEPDPAEWFKAKYGTYPDYSELLDSLCKTPAERQQLLRSYFEATEPERQQGLKQPTKAHRAVAKLLAKGHVRLVLTTNFDRLLEQAVADEGVAPVVISTADATEGALPLAHQTTCIIKLHGDYLDSRIKNTPTELATYDDRLSRLVDQVFDQFGLVVCGWSAQWDMALRAAIERSTSRRFSLFWATRGKPTVEADKLIALRGGTKIEIAEADTFFSKVQQLVEGLEQSNRPHPLSVEAVAALTKRYLADPSQLIALSDLVHDETENARIAVGAVNEEILSNPRARMDGAAVAGAFERFRGAVERVQTLAIQGGAWGGPAHTRLWPQLVERLATPPAPNGTNVASWLRFYPSLVLIYSIGLAAVAQGELATLHEVLYQPKIREGSENKPLMLGDFWAQLHDPVKSIKEHERHHTPRSEHFAGVLREPLRRYLPDDTGYDEAFDQVEYLIALTYLDLDKKERMMGSWAPPGRFCWKAHGYGRNLLRLGEEELAAAGTSWSPLVAGFFGGKVERAKELQAKLREFVGRLPYH